MTTTMTITLLVIAAASIAMNVLQWRERKAERAEHNKTIANAAKLENKLDELRADYENECNHRAWAIGRIKDQQAVIDQLKANNKKSKQYKK